MKKILTWLILCILGILIIVTPTYCKADGTWHYCELCGREHAGTICPEQCIDCENGTPHKWYECPNYTGRVYCKYCDDEVEDHNDNTCPHGGECFWSDTVGSFIGPEYVANYSDIRTPVFCELCEHWGYHTTEECLKYSSPTPVPTVEPTPVPTVKPTPVPTAEPTPTQCTHSSTSQRLEDSWIEYKEDDPNTCYVLHEKYKVYCKDCGARMEPLYENKDFPHNFGADNCCVNCGYERPCEHADKYTNYYYEDIFIDGSNRYCYRIMEHEEITCSTCGAVIQSMAHEVEKVEHEYVNGVCIYCGRKGIAPTPVPSPTPTPCSHSNTQRLVGSWEKEIVGTEEVCYIPYRVKRQKCLDCDYYAVLDPEYGEQVTQHAFGYDNVCDVCGWEKIVEPTPTSVIILSEDDDTNQNKTIWVIVMLFIGIVCVIIGLVKWKK